MAQDVSVTRWLEQLRTGNPEAAEVLFRAYFERLVRLARQHLARKRLQGARRREADEEDVAICAFASFCRGAAQGRFPQLADRDDLWRLLVVVTARKASTCSTGSAASSVAGARCAASRGCSTRPTRAMAVSNRW
jgi:hypothetical protein